MLLRIQVGIGALGVLLGAQCNAQSHPQGGWLADARYRVSPSQPTAEVRLWAWFDFTPNLAELYASGRFEALASEPGFVGYNCIMDCGGLATVEPSVIGDLIPGQFHDPRFPGNPANPIAVVEVWWTATTFSPRRVVVSTRTEAFFTYKSMISATSYRFPLNYVVEGQAAIDVGPDCFPDCDSSTGVGTLDIFDFLCFQNLYAVADPYACDCDTQSGPGVCDIFDFLCFQNAFAAGCP